MKFNMVLNNLNISRFSLLINGEVSGLFKSSHGIKQGDPLSPLLLILCVEVFLRGLNSRIHHQAISPYSLPRQCPVVSHLAFANDVVIFLQERGGLEISEEF
ncbi:hypothetical protein ACH5RR_021521 [Cinchona calisaya]|uniref:Reverse transcriptase domain-containing protein n=1 Tax=Cinchona calisaya TaxID=153742 RepID=A0ABD2ZKF6_9GENT